MSLDITLQTPEGIAGDHNITHNLKEMAIAAGFGQELWRQEETDIHFASDLIEILAVGVARLKGRPLHYDQFNAKNGWGMREVDIVMVFAIILYSSILMITLIKWI